MDQPCWEIPGSSEISQLDDENKRLKELLSECQESMQWMIETFKHKHDDTTGHDPDHGPGHYSPELTKGIETLEKVKEVEKA